MNDVQEHGLFCFKHCERTIEQKTQIRSRRHRTTTDALYAQIELSTGVRASVLTIRRSVSAGLVTLKV